ncbi:MAG: hypothetical protein U0W24_02135 [Bacteroidales bacterium]
MKKYFLSIILFIISVGIFSAKGQKSKTNPTLSLEIDGVNVVPHYVSGEIPNYRDEKQFLSKYKPGALIRIFIRNTDTVAGINPEVLFNGKTGQELISSNIVTFCDVPDIRQTTTKISVEIPAGAMDCYLLNVVDSNFYTHGITLKFRDKNTGKNTEKKIDIKAPDFYASRIVFNSTDGSRFPDGFYVYFKNDARSEVHVKQVKIWKAGKSYTEHWWSETFTPGDIKWFGDQGNIAAHSMNGAFVNTGRLPFGEIIVEFEIIRNSSVEELFYVVKPMIINFDIGLGWDFELLSKSEAYCKTMKFMHFNTVNSAASDFLANKEWSEKYPMKRFSKLQQDASTTDENELKTIHGAEHFGEPQFGKRPAQEIFNYYTAYRNSGFPTTLTLSHEPGFFLYAGVVDFAHFDAYRVVAPHADKWGDYKKYGNKNVKWGSPLETIGDYMRTLNRINYPNTVAAWTQAMADDWESRSRKNAGNPNNLEMRIQAYEAIANGATSLYWFNMGGKTVINNRSSLAEIQRVNREIMVVGELLSKTAPFWWLNRFMDLDLNVLAGPDFAALFAIDLKYKVSDKNQFVSSGNRTETMTFKIPAYLKQCNEAVKITHEGVFSVNVKVTDGNAVISDTFETNGMYILYHPGNQDLKELLTKRYNEIRATEASFQFDPINNDADFRILTGEVTKFK